MRISVRILCFTLKTNLFTVHKKKLMRPFFFWTLFFGMCVLSVINLAYYSTPTCHPSTTDGIPDLHDVGSAFVVDSPECRIPALDPWSDEAKGFVLRARRFRCLIDKKPPLVASNASAIFIVQESLVAYDIRDIKDLECCYTPFRRNEDEQFPSDDMVRFDDNCVIFKDSASVQGVEFLRVECFVYESKIYEDYHAFVPRKVDVEERCVNTSLTSDKDALSVLVLGLDSVSRLNFHRQVPATLRRLKELNAIEFLGYNSLGNDTIANTVPILAGLSEGELEKVCKYSSIEFMDDCRFVWSDFRDAGYRTAYGEDNCEIGMFNYQKIGFKKQPTDYYLRPFLYTLEEELDPESNIITCVGPRTLLEVLLDYMKKFYLEFERTLTFGLFWENSVSHSHFNLLALGDDDLKSFINFLHEKRVLEHLALILISDHGFRWGNFSKTYQGRLEERLPALFLVLPTWFRERYATAVANARQNAHRLTSPLDVHETLLDLMRPTRRLSQEAIHRRSQALLQKASTPPPRGISLFLPIPADRTCKVAGIPPLCCTCKTYIPFDKNTSIVRTAAQVLVDRINLILLPFWQCSPLRLKTVLSVLLQLRHAALQEIVTDAIDLYVLTVITVPGNAVFEGTVRHDKVGDSNFSVIDRVSRLNLYGNQSSCVHSYYIKKYCYCIL